MAHKDDIYLALGIQKTLGHLGAIRFADAGLDVAVATFDSAWAAISDLIKAEIAEEEERRGAALSPEEEWFFWGRGLMPAHTSGSGTVAYTVEGGALRVELRDARGGVTNAEVTMTIRKGRAPSVVAANALSKCAAFWAERILSAFGHTIYSPENPRFARACLGV